MSGGQKQRLALARALYADKDIYLMDDPLSAVDIHVGRHIFTECLINSLKNKPNKTILFVTHQLQVMVKIRHGTKHFEVLLTLKFFFSLLVCLTLGKLDAD